MSGLEINDLVEEINDLVELVRGTLQDTVKVMRHMAQDKSIAKLSGPDAITVVADAIEHAAHNALAERLREKAALDRKRFH